MDFARSVGGDHCDRRSLGPYRADLGDRDLEIGKHLEKIGFKRLVGAIELIDQQDRRAGRITLERLKERSLDQEALAEDVLGECPLIALSRGLSKADLDHLPRIIPFVDRRRDIEAFIALQAHEPTAERFRQNLRDLGLADAGFSLEEEGPLFLEGEAGVGKTEIAKVLAETLGRRLVRLQCYEGLDVASAVYEWNYPRQMIEIRLAEAAGQRNQGALAQDIFGERFLIKRPLLQALESDPAGAPVLLIDELDRADEPFEAYLLEVLSDFQVTIPEIGTIRAEAPPIAVITSNRTREIHDALKRRCFYYWVDYPDAAREIEILRLKAPDAPAALSLQIVSFVQTLRKRNLFKLPGIAETIDWAHALTQLDVVELDPRVVDDTLGVLLKYQDDIAKIQGSEAATVLAQVQAELAAAQAAEAVKRQKA